MFSFEWALTHRSFPRILPDSSNLRSSSHIHLKVWRKNEFSSVTCLLQDRFQILFIFGSTFPLLILPEYLNNSWWFLSSFSTCEDRRRVSRKSCSILFNIHGSSLMPSSHNCFWLREFFSPIRSISWVVFHFFPPKAFISELCIFRFQLLFSKSYRCIVQVFSNQLVISLFSCI